MDSSKKTAVLLRAAVLLALIPLAVMAQETGPDASGLRPFEFREVPYARPDRPSQSNEETPATRSFEFREIPYVSGQTVKRVSGEAPVADVLRLQPADVFQLWTVSASSETTLDGLHPQTNTEDNAALNTATVTSTGGSLNSYGQNSMPISLEEMRLHALRNNEVIRQLGLRVTVQPAAAQTIHDPAITTNDPLSGLQAALSDFDPVLAASATHNNFDRVFNNVTIGGGATELTQDLFNIESSLSKVMRNGARVGVRRRTFHDSNNRLGNLFPSVWEDIVETEIRQPLLQGRGRAFNDVAGPNAQPGFNFRNGIVIAQINDEISRADVEIAMQRLLASVERAYWELYFAYRDYNARLRARDVTHRTWQQVKARLDEGLQGGEAYQEAQARAQYYQYEDLVAEAYFGSDRQSGVRTAERQLRRLVGMPPDDSSILEPIEALPMFPDFLDWSDLYGRAMRNRIELRRQQARIRQEELKLAAAGNFVLPRLDAIARYRLRGFGDDFAGSGAGRFNNAVDDRYTFDHDEWELGMEMNVPIGRRRARAGVRQAESKLARERAILREQEHQIAHDLRDAVGQAEQTRASVIAANHRVEAAHDRAQSTLAAFEAGKVNVDLLLESQQQLYEAERRSHEALVEQIVSHLAIRRESGMVLKDGGVTFAADAEPIGHEAVEAREGALQPADGRSANYH